jgi:molybdopterin molybdotransferase
MLSVADAQARVLEQVRPLPAVRLRLDGAALGLVLAEDVASDLDMPPFTKAMMDGYALRSADLPGGVGPLTVVEEITAGMTPTRALGKGEAARIMTGAPVPDGADAVVMVEHTRMAGGGKVDINEPALAPGINILPRGQEMRRGEAVLKAGALLRPQEFGLLATVGRAEVLAHPAPRVAILATGDELVDASEQPRPGQIRNGNGPMLLGQVCRAGGIPVSLGIAADRMETLRQRIALGLREDVLVLAGGVSAGKLDLVPQALAELGVRALFHKVAMKPGKPVLFGIQPRDEGSRPRLVFGLPGNPVSALVCFELFVRPALRALMGLSPGPRLVQAVLCEDFTHRTDRPTYRPARLHNTASGWRVQPVPWFGSPDLRGVTSANAFVVLPEGEHRHRAGEVFPVLCVEELDVVAACGLAATAAGR